MTSGAPASRLMSCWTVQGLCRAVPGEQLAYVAALAAGAPLLFGDRPKRETYARLGSLTSLSELDAFFGWQVRHDSCELMGNLAHVLHADQGACACRPPEQPEAHFGWQMRRRFLYSHSA